jgi:hypothetical protein
MKSWKLTYWPGSAFMPSSWKKNPALVKELERYHIFSSDKTRREIRTEISDDEDSILYRIAYSSDGYELKRNNEVGNIDPLIGRHFVSKSNNIARIKKLGDGAMRVTWKNKPTNSDKNEFEMFVESVIGPIEATTCDENGEEEYHKWKEESGL